MYNNRKTVISGTRILHCNHFTAKKKTYTGNDVKCGLSQACSQALAYVVQSDAFLPFLATVQSISSYHAVFGGKTAAS